MARVVVAQPRHDCSPAIHAKIAEGKAQHAAGATLEALKAWLSAYAWARDPVAVPQAVWGLNHEHFELAAAALGCEAASAKVASARDEDLKTRALNQCMDAREVLGRAPRLELPRVDACTAPLGWRIEVTVDGNRIDARRYRDVPGGAGSLVVHVLPIWSAPPAEAPRRDPRPLLVGAIGAGALGVGALITGRLAAHEEDQARNACPAGRGACADESDAAAANAALQDANSLAQLTNVLLIGSAAFAVGGAIWYWASPAPVAEAPPLELSCSGEGCNLRGTVRF